RDFHVTGVQTCALPIFAKLKGELIKLSVTAITDEEKLHYEEVKTSIEECNQRIQSITKDVGLIDKLKSINIIKDNLDYELISLRSEERRVGKEWRCGR